MHLIGKGITTALAIVLFLFLGANVFADSLVSMTDIQYHSEFEKEAFYQLIEGNQIDYLVLFLAGDSTVKHIDYQNILSSINQFVGQFDRKRYQRLKNTRRVKRIYQGVHESMLDKYDHSKSFAGIFENGEYQCVTSSMLFSLVFNELSIPYHIKLLPTHAYLVAFPEENYILVETTDPIKGTIPFDDRFKSDYIHFLRDHRLISAKEYQNSHVSELFEKYYMDVETIDQKQLAGAQYFNLSIVAITDRNFMLGHQLMEKAWLLHPGSKNSFMLLFSLANAINDLSISDPVYSIYLSKLMKFHNRGVTSDQLFALFSNLTNRQLLFDGNTVLYDESYANIISVISDTSLYNDIAFLYNFERGRTLFLNSEYREAEHFISKALTLKPNSADVKAMFFGIMLARLEELKVGDEAYSLSKFEDYFVSISNLKDRFSQLNNMKGFRQAWLYFCLGLMEQFYEFDDPGNGEKYRQIFESDYPFSLTGYSGINKGIANAYAAAAKYYRLNNKMVKKQEIVNTGLKYLPGDTTISQYLEQVQ